MVGWQRDDARNSGATVSETEGLRPDRPAGSGEPAGERAPGALDDAAPDAAGLDAAVLAERLATAEAEIARLKDEYLRALAETENVRRRAQRDRQEASQYAVSGFARALLSVADNLRRALASVEAEARTKDPALEALTSGVEMTEKELLSVFERNGVKAIPAVGQPFDPHVHEALYEIPDPSVPHGTVLQVLEAGYTLHDRTLRPARVGIARGGPKAPAPSAPASDTEAAAPTAEPERDASTADGQPRSPIAEDDGVIDFAQHRSDSGREGGYRGSPESAPRAPGRRFDDTY